MFNNVKVQNLLALNVGVIFMSTSGLFGRYIDMPVAYTLTLRAIMAFAVLFTYCRFRKINLGIEKKDRFKVILGGIFMSLHWVTYFWSLQLSSVAIGMLSLFTYPIITSFLEPIILKTKFHKIQFVLAAFVFFGVYLLVPEFSFENKYFQAISLGVLSAILYSLRNIVTKKEVQKYDGSVLMMYQLIIISLTLSPSLFIYIDVSPVSYLPSLLTLVFVTTVLGHTMFVKSLKFFTATTASIIASIQPILGIIMGFLFLDEIPDMYTLIGGFIIISTVVFENLRAFMGTK